MSKLNPKIKFETNVTEDDIKDIDFKLTKEKKVSKIVVVDKPKKHGRTNTKLF